MDETFFHRVRLANGAVISWRPDPQGLRIVRADGSTVWWTLRSSPVTIISTSL